MLWLLACTGEAGKDGEGQGVTGTVAASGYQGGGEVSALVSTGSAFGVNTAGEMVLVLSPNPDATCDDAATWLLGGDDDWSPEAVVPVGTCGLYLSGAYESGPLTVEDDATAVTISLACAMDDGEWVYEERDDGDVGWYFEGPWWVGSPDGFSLTVDGGDEADYDVSLDMDGYSGSFSYDVENPDPDSASGAVSGSTTAEWCTSLGPALAR